MLTFWAVARQTEYSFPELASIDLFATADEAESYATHVLDWQGVQIETAHVRSHEWLLGQINHAHSEFPPRAKDIDDDGADDHEESSK